MHHGRRDLVDSHQRVLDQLGAVFLPGGHPVKHPLWELDKDGHLFQVWCRGMPPGVLALSSVGCHFLLSSIMASAHAAGH